MTALDLNLTTKKNMLRKRIRKIRQRKEDSYEKYLQEKGTPVAARSSVPDRFIIYTAESTGSGSEKTSQVRISQ